MYQRPGRCAGDAPAKENPYPFRPVSSIPPKGRWRELAYGDRIPAYSVTTMRLRFRHLGEGSVGRHLIVDGYNLARSSAVFLSEDPSGPEGRAELCALLSGYAREKGFRLTVVFDGQGAGNPERTRLLFKGGTAVFSSRSETADDVIRDLSRGALAGTFVVTSDRGLAGTLPARGVSVVSSEEFAGRLAAYQREGVKGPLDEEEEEGRRTGKKGEGHKKKKRDRVRDRILRKL